MRSGYRRCSKCETNRAERFFVGTRGKVCARCRKASTRSSARDRRIQETYGLTPEEYLALFYSQGGRCATCGGQRSANLDVDHDHTTGLIRGLLCARCNRRLLTAAMNNPEVLRRAANYLEDPPAQKILGARYVNAEAIRTRRRRH